MLVNRDYADSELVALLRAGSHAAFTEIYQRYWEYLYQSGYAVLKDADTCADLVQEIFVWLWQNRTRHTMQTFKPYLRAAMKYKVANAIRHGKVRDAFFTHAVERYTEASVEENAVEVKELREITARFTESLPERAREIFRLSRHELLNNKEIAEKLGISVKTVENQMNINLKKLKTALGKMSSYLFITFFYLSWVLSPSEVI